VLQAIPVLLFHHVDGHRLPDSPMDAVFHADVCKDVPFSALAVGDRLLSTRIPKMHFHEVGKKIHDRLREIKSSPNR
jgi:hypothetical protein